MIRGDAEPKGTRTLGLLLRCSTCHRPGLAYVLAGGTMNEAILLEFFPAEGFTPAALPGDAPANVVKEFREAERCAGTGAYRAASAMMRSALEKTLLANGYGSMRNLQAKIDAAADDGAITQARKERAHEEVRVLGNDVMHDEWRTVGEDDFSAAHHYTQRIIEDFYDDRVSVTKLLTDAGRLTAPPADATDEG